MYILDIIKDDYKTKWKSGDKILINAPTGSGKSTFFGNVISSYCEENNLSALMLSNRQLLKIQNQSLFKSNVDCFNYQAFENMVKKKNKDIKKLLKKYDIIFIDECHYFFLDSRFNCNTDIILEYLMESHEDKIIIFASATPEIMFGCISCDNFDYVYTLERNYDYIDNIIFYESDSDVLDILRNLPPYEKAIYFASRIEDSAMGSRTLKNARFICSQYNRQFRKFSDNESYKQIIEEEKFHCKILMTTSVLDNGINIKDNQLKHILIDLMDETTIIQCVGRKRILSNDDRITIYCKLPTKHQVFGNIYGNKNRLLYAERTSEKVLAKYLITQWEDVLKKGYIKYICDIFNYDENKAYIYNKIKSNNTVIELLNKYKNIKLFDDGQKEFMESFKERVYNTDNSEYDKYNFKSLAANIDEYDLPYKLQKIRERKGINRDKYYWIITDKS